MSDAAMSLLLLYALGSFVGCWFFFMLGDEKPTRKHGAYILFWPIIFVLKSMKGVWEIVKE